MNILRLFKSLAGTGRRRSPWLGRDPWQALAWIFGPEGTPESLRWAPHHLRTLERGGDLDLSRVEALLGPWYEAHPLEVTWNDYGFRIIDPFAVDVNDVVVGTDDPTLLKWARALRTLDIVGDGALVFHHGIGATELLDVLRDPNAPRVEALAFDVMADGSDEERDAIVRHIIEDPSMDRLQHISLYGSGFGPRHLATLLASPRAGQLRSLDLGECLDDARDDEIGAVLERIGNLSEVEHLNLDGAIRTGEHAKTLADTALPRLTHLRLAAVCDHFLVAALADSDVFPALLAWAKAVGQEHHISILLNRSAAPARPGGDR
jgi:hypothetical protein